MNLPEKNFENETIAILGLGYVGLPLAVEFGKKRQVIGYDINERRIQELLNQFDRTKEISKEELKESLFLKFSSNLEEIRKAKIFIVTVPTPIDEHKNPDLTPIVKATETVSKVLKKGDIVIYESTVYPGCTEEVCVPILEKQTGLKFNLDFFCGYSPERINPGDKFHRIKDIKKVTSGSTPEIGKIVDRMYSNIIVAGTHLASSIKVAEAAKVIENTQRDLNIALVNELAMIFNKLKIDTEEVLLAAGTKWNFLPFRPGLVGGHCIGVDPYYLTHKAESIGYHPQVILAGRRVNDGMGEYVANQLIKSMSNKYISISGSRILIMGLSFKENCPDIRNTRVVDILSELRQFRVEVDIFDPLVDSKDALHEYGIRLIEELNDNSYDGILLAVSHSIFKEMGIKKIRRLAKKNAVVYDLKNLFEKDFTDIRL